MVLNTKVHGSTIGEGITVNLDHVYLDSQSHYNTDIIELLSELYDS